jgi:hypothetical protein
MRTAVIFVFIFGPFAQSPILLFPAAHLGKQNHLGKETGRVTEVRLVLPVPTCKRDGVVRFQVDLTGIGGVGLMPSTAWKAGSPP